MEERPNQGTIDRKAERLIFVFFTIHQLSILAFAYKEKWDFTVMTLIFISFVFGWVVFLRKDKSCHFRVGCSLAMVMATLMIYSVHSGEIVSALLPLTSIAVVTGLCGYSDLTKYPCLVWAALVIYHGPVARHFSITTMEDVYRYLYPIGNALLAILTVSFWVRKRNESCKRMMEVIDRQKRAEKGKDEFLANLSHEIRTPINTISGMSEILLQEKDPEKIKEEVYAIQSGSRNLMNIVRDILDFSEFQSGKLEIVEDVYDVTSIINDIVRMTVAQKAEKDLEIIVDIDSKIPSKLLGDEKRIRRLIMNIVDNAIKFTNEGGVYIQFGARREEYGVNFLVSVRDTGIGMSQKTMEKLYTVYNQADSSSRRQERGIGLGLAISQTIVHQMGGIITVKSKQGEGTVMRVAIPQKIIDDQPIVRLEEGENKQFIAYLDMEQYDSSIRDCYTELIEHICNAIPGKAAICRNLAQMKRRTEKDRFDFAVTGALEYRREKEYFDTLSEQTSLVIIADANDDCEIDNSNIYIIQRPFTILSIASVLESVRCKKDAVTKKEKARFIAPDAKVLVVDDNLMNIKVVEGLLEKYQIQVVYALSGIEALGKVASRDFDFIFMDYMMPEMDGVETMKRIRNLGGRYCSMVPIIALTANAVAGAREQLIAEGFNDFVEKPIELSTLKRVILHNVPQNKIIYLDEEKAQDPEKNNTIKETQLIEEKEAASPKEASSGAFFVEGLDMKTGMMYCGGEEAYKIILGEFARKGDENWNNLLRMYREKDWKNYTIALHAIKSSMLSIGAKNLSEKAKALELAGKAEDIAFIRANHEDMIQELKHVIANICDAVGKTRMEEKSEELLPEISDEEFDRFTIAFEDAMYELDGVAMKEILSQLENYSYCGKNLKEHLKSVAHKVEMADYMSAVEVVLHLRDHLKREE